VVDLPVAREIHDLPEPPRRLVAPGKEEMVDPTARQALGIAPVGILGETRIGRLGPRRVRQGEDRAAPLLRRAQPAADLQAVGPTGSEELGGLHAQ